MLPVGQALCLFLFQHQVPSFNPCKPIGLALQWSPEVSCWIMHSPWWQKGSSHCPWSFPKAWEHRQLPPGPFSPPGQLNPLIPDATRREVTKTRPKNSLIILKQWPQINWQYKWQQLTPFSAICNSLGMILPITCDVSGHLWANDNDVYLWYIDFRHWLRIFS